MEQFEKSTRTLELPAVLEMLAREAVSEPAKEKVLQLIPATDASEVSRRLRETSAAKAMMTLRGSPSFSGVKDVRASLNRAEMGGMLNPRELLDIAAILQTSRSVQNYASGRNELGHTEIDHLFLSLRSNRHLEDRITGSILGEDEIADAASSELADIRRKMRAANARVREALQKIISSPSYNKALQEPIITQRDNRYVVPVKAEHKGAVPGLVHDVSASGATLFIEPMGAVKANNELRELAAQEKREIERILMELSSLCADSAEDIAANFTVLVALDAIFAKAKLSYTMNAMEAELTERLIVLRRARHPLLDKNTAVPIDLELGSEFDTLVITGPNTGGKTVSLKTVGLLCLMNQCGLHVPAADGTRLPVFGGILADIGDEQSIEQSLSTFSAHMTNIVRILDECSPDTLLLFDELGAGTDPVEGAALAISIIERARKCGATIAATTHYAELKVYATTQPGVQNASCEFDVETLRPTYRLLIGIPGKSNAFAISQRLGLPESIIEDARSRLTSEDATLEDTISKLNLTQQMLERDREEVSRRLRAAEEDRKQAERMRRELSVRLEKADEKARNDANRILEQARSTAEQAYAELDRMRSAAKESADAQAENEARAELQRRLNEASQNIAPKLPEPEKKRSARPVAAGDMVEITAMGVKAEVISVSTDRILTLQAGIMRVTAREDEVYLLEDEKKVKVKLSGGYTQLQREAVSTEIDLRGMMTDEAIPLMEKWLDSVAMAKHETATIIHGKGTGALRKAVQQSLKRNKLVKSFRLGVFGEGESGVTIVELK